MKKGGSLYLSRRRGAIELSISTIVIIVLAVTMLIMGMVVTRSVMCGALSLTGDVNSKVKSQLNAVFDSTEGEIACVGSGDAAKVVPGKEHYINCVIKAQEKAEYSAKVSDVRSSSTTLTKDKLQKWIAVPTWKSQVAPNDRDVRKVISIKVPNDSPEGNVRFTLEFTKNGELISTKDIDWEVTRVGIIKSAAC